MRFRSRSAPLEHGDHASAGLDETRNPVSLLPKGPTLDSLAVAGTVFACTSAGAILGLFARRVLPASHLSAKSKDVVKRATGIVATLVAIVLGLLVSASKSSYDAQRSGFQELSANLILLDRSLQVYGPETKEVRERLRHVVSLLLDLRWPSDGSRPGSLNSRELNKK